MTVKQLINKLKKLPEDATVTMCNNEMYIDGEYKVTGVLHSELYSTVEIYTDYKRKLN